MSILDGLKRNDKVQNSLALYYLFEYGKQTLQDDYKMSDIKKQIKSNLPKNSILDIEYIFKSIEIAKQMTDLSVKDISEFIYSNVKEQKRQERSR